MKSYRSFPSKEWKWDRQKSDALAALLCGLLVILAFSVLLQLPSGFFQGVVGGVGAFFCFAGLFYSRQSRRN